MPIFRYQQNKPINLEKILEQLGYLQFYESSAGYRASKSEVTEKAFLKFCRMNEDYLKFLKIEISPGKKLLSKGFAGIIPLESAVPQKIKPNLIIEPMVNWELLSEFATVTKNRNWLNLNIDWQVSRQLDIELWHFSKPFITEALAVLERPARGFRTICSNDQNPKGRTDWTDFAVKKRPYHRCEFTNYLPQMTLDVLPHALIKWCVKAIRNSIKIPNLISNSLLDKLQIIECMLGSDLAPVIPTPQNLARLPQTGAWSGYLSLYREMSHIAKLAGVIKEGSDHEFGCAYSIDTSDLFESFTAFLCENFASKNGFHFFKDSNDSSRIGLERVNKNGNFRMLSSLRPDIILRNQDTLIVIDAKYKHHFDLASKNQSSGEWYDELRNDIHQVLSYGIFSDKPKKIFLLTHPKLESSSNDFEIWRIPKNPNKLIGFLPIHFGKETKLDTLMEAYHTSLSKILAEVESY